jgi:hypothetical protein
MVVVSERQGRLALSFHQFERAMGVAVKPGAIAVCTRQEVWFLRSSADITPKIEPPGMYDACFLARTAHFTGDIQAHESAWIGNEFWVVNTLFSCLAALHPYYSFAPRWRPPFVSALAPDDRCHLNGMAVVNGQPRYVTALGETDTQEGWRSVKATGGCLVEVSSDQLFYLHTGKGQLDAVQLSSQCVDVVATVPGIARGLALHDGFAFIGLSNARPSLDGVPIVEHRENLKCGVLVADVRRGTQVGLLEFHTGVEEVFDVQILPEIRSPYISGPLADRDSGPAPWTVPPAFTQ